MPYKGTESPMKKIKMSGGVTLIIQKTMTIHRNLYRRNRYAPNPRERFRFREALG
jgi:hypothetical protein